MTRNIEIKARSRDLREQARLAAGLSDGPPQLFIQEDTFLDPRQPEFLLRDLECCLKADRFDVAMVVEREMDLLLLKRLAEEKDLS